MSPTVPAGSDPATVRLALAPAQRLAVAVAGVLLVALVAGIGLVLLSLESTRAEIQVTRAEVVDVTSRVQRLDRRLAPVLTDVAAVTGMVSRPQLRDGVRSAAAAVDVLPGLARDASSGVGAFLTALRRVQDPGSGISRTLSSVDRLLAGLRSAGVPSQTTCDRRLLTRPGIDQLGCVLRTLPNARRLLSDQRRLTSRSIRIQTDTRALVRQGVTLLTDSLAVQRETLGHARSLDRKVPEAAVVLP